MTEAYKSGVLSLFLENCTKNKHSNTVHETSKSELENFTHFEVSREVRLTETISLIEISIFFLKLVKFL